MTAQRPPADRGMTNDPADPTQRMPEAPAGLDEESRAILEQQHTGNHNKPAGENADRRPGGAG